MTWRVGIDEAGYGPNLGPLVMTTVACQVADSQAEACLWDLLGAVVRKGTGPTDGRLLVDDSKVVYSRDKGLGSLEHQVLVLLGRPVPTLPLKLANWLGRLCVTGLEELHGETWYTGQSLLPLAANLDHIHRDGPEFDRACVEVGVGPFLVRAVLVPTPRFNNLLGQHGSKGAILAHGFMDLLRAMVQLLPGTDPIHIAVDKHGGRNTYTGMIQDAVPQGMVWAEQEGMQRSSYRVEGLDRCLRLVFQPRADAEHFVVALASMTAKYVRELLMDEFNRYWLGQVPGLKPTAGYPLDAIRFLEAIQAQATLLGLERAALWREK
jgi:ribonuclease HII